MRGMTKIALLILLILALSIVLTLRYNTGMMEEEPPILGAPREGGKRMAVSEKKKASNAKWDSANMSTLGCRVKKAQAAAFKAYCEAQGKTSNTVLKEYVLDCIGEGDEWSDNEPT